jgi:hypothetical protein
MVSVGPPCILFFCYFNINLNPMGFTGTRSDIGKMAGWTRYQNRIQIQSPFHKLIIFSNKLYKLDITLAVLLITYIVTISSLILHVKIKELSE